MSLWPCFIAYATWARQSYDVRSRVCDKGLSPSRSGPYFLELRLLGLLIFTGLRGLSVELLCGELRAQALLARGACGGRCGLP